MKALGRHILMDLYECDIELLMDPFAIQQIMEEAALAANATILKSAFHHFNPQGVSGVVIIAESHFAIHTWPEYGYAALDFFTCGDAVDPLVAQRVVVEKLRASKNKSVTIKRGTHNLKILEDKLLE